MDQGIGESVDYGERTLPRVLSRAVGMYADRPALRDAQTSLTFAETGRRVEVLVRGLSRLAAPRERVLTVLGNHVDHVCLWFAVAEAALVSVPVNTDVTSSQLAQYIGRSEASVVVVEPSHIGLVLEALDSAPSVRTVVVHDNTTDRTPTSVVPPVGVKVLNWSALNEGGAVAPVEIEPWDLHSVMFSSGSTGGPKSVLVTQAQTVTRAMVVDQRPPRGNGVVMVTVPLFHVAGQCRGVLGPLMTGMEVVVVDRFSVSRFWPDVRESQVTSTLLMGSMMDYLLHAPPSEEDARHPLERVYAAPVSARAAEFAARFGVDVYASYGSTEAGTVSTGASVEPGSLGWLHPDFEASIVDEYDVPVAEGEAGELVLRAVHPWLMTPGYERDPVSTVALYRNQWLHTGDLVRRTDTTELIFVGRAKEVIRVNGENVSPSDIEDFVGSLDGVVECAAVAVNAEEGEDAIKLVVIPTDSAVKVEDICSAIAQGLPRYMFPRYVQFVDVLPKTATQKIRRADLRDASGSEVWDVAHLRPARR